MKKIISVMLSIILTVSIFSGCAESTTEGETMEENITTTTAEEKSTESENANKTGNEEVTTAVATTTDDSLKTANVRVPIPERVPSAINPAWKPITNDGFIKANGKNLYTKSGKGELVNLRGTNVGGWLLQEFWMTPTEASTKVHAELDIYNYLTEKFGKETMLDLVDLYQYNYFSEKDFDNCFELGINCLRLPFWYRNIVDENNKFKDEWYKTFDWFIEEAGKRGIYVILDMHGAPGSQNGSDHSGIDGGDKKEKASEFFFGKNAEANQSLYYTMWEKIAERYKGNPVVAGYDLLNEPYCTYRYNSSYNEYKLHTTLWKIYDEAYKKIRAIDPDHLIIMEATWDAKDLPNPDDYNWTNVMYQYHNYLYDDYDNKEGKQITSMENKIKQLNAANYNVPSYIGEFSFFNNYDAWDAGLALLTNAGLNWTTWTYKVVSNYGNWGLYNQSVGEINLQNANEERIRNIWGKVGNSNPNNGLIKVAKKYFSAPAMENDLTVKQKIAKPVSFESGDYYISGVNSKQYITTSDKGLVAATDKDAKQQFTITVLDDGTVLINKKNGDFITFGSDNILYATEKDKNKAEKFNIVKNGNNYSLQAIKTGLYVCADENFSDMRLVADRSEPSGWESFIIKK